VTQDVLVVGGAGYIGSHMVRCLRHHGFVPVVLDNLSGGSRQAVGNAELLEADCGDAAFLADLFSRRAFAGVMHFASFIQVGESVVEPAKYYENNVARTITLLNAMIGHDTGPFIFSSTAAIFGYPQQVPINEDHPQRPINPYGRGKRMVEELLHDYHLAYGLRYGCLRYFNAAGAEPGGSIGECHEPETHLIPLVLRVASGRMSAIRVFGTDYATPDGTCIRDYIHVCDLAEAHMILLRALRGRMAYGAYNLGTGRGYSVREVIEAAKTVTGRPIAVAEQPRRPGDPDRLIADGTAMRQLGWKPERSDLSTMIADAWAWERQLNERSAG